MILTVSLYPLPQQDAQSQSTLDTLLPVYDALTEKAYFDPVFLNDLAPTEARDRYHFIQLLKTKGCPAETVLYTYSTGNNKGNYRFIWLVPSGITADELQSQNASVVHKLSAIMPYQANATKLYPSLWACGKCPTSILPPYRRYLDKDLTLKMQKWWLTSDTTTKVTPASMSHSGKLTSDISS